MLGFAWSIRKLIKNILNPLHIRLVLKMIKTYLLSQFAMF